MFTVLFLRPEAVLDFDPATRTMRRGARGPVASVETHHLRDDVDFNAMIARPEFLNATPDAPDITFRSTAVVLTGARSAEATGDLTMTAATRPVTLAVSSNGGHAGHALDAGARMGFPATGAIIRSDVGVDFGMPAHGSRFGIGDRVEIIIEAEFVRPDAPKQRCGEIAAWSVDAPAPRPYHCNMLMTPDPAAPPREAIAARAEAALAGRTARVTRIDVAGRFYWVKCEERLTLRMRLQKGGAGSAFAAERAALRTLAAVDAPVPPIVAEGAGYFVTPDCGRPLRDLMRDPALRPADRVGAFAAAAEALAGLHAAGFSHGRPAIKDICWDGRRATFLDLERFSPRRNTRRGHVEDLVILLFSAFVETGGPSPETEALERAYRSRDPAGIWPAAGRLCRRLRWLGPLTWPVRRLRRSPEFLAIPPTLAAFGAG
jgi:polyisoprenoid-binding protein YceI